MELFFSNVPSHLSDDQLKRELTPYMNALGIDQFACDKSNKNMKAWVTFLTVADGKKFLNEHGKENNGAPDSRRFKGPLDAKIRPRAIARLHILKTAIFVERSKNQADPWVLNHLKYAKDQQKDPTDRNPKLPPIRANISYISCGQNAFVDPSDTLTFLEQTYLIGRPENVAQFGRRFFTLTMGNWRMDIANITIQDLIADPAVSCLTFVLTETPKFYQKITDDEQLHGPEKWRRKASIEMWTYHANYVAGCLVYRICLYAQQFSEVIMALKVRDILSVTRQSMPVNSTPRPYEEDYTTSLNVFSGKIAHAAKQSGKLLPFVILFQVQSLVTNNYLHPAGGTRLLDVMERVALDCKRQGQPLPFTTDAMKTLGQKLPYPCPGTDPKDLGVEDLMQRVIQHEYHLRIEDPERTKDYGARILDHQAWVLKANVTPTRILLSGPDTESKNRVLRKFGNRTDYFLRVTFGDEDGQDLPYNPKVSNKDVFDRYRKVLQDGIKIAGRHFSFLGFSHSSLRSHSAWFSAPFVDNDMKYNNADSIIKSLGDFRDIRIPAKCAARIGQAFSETPYEVDLENRKIELFFIQDVKSPDGARVFSDGVGTISRAAMEEVWDQLPRQSQTPTCFQIRLGGVKGMLALDTTLKGKRICIRKESMLKFESRETRYLGICDAASQPLRMYLNRQLIKILEDMGTDDGWFMAQQTKALKLLRAVTATAANTSTFLQYQDVATTVGLSRLIKVLDNMSIDYRRDKFMKSLVEHVVLRELRLLKHKARIPVDQGVTLFGVMDETGFLQEGEIYVTFDSNYDKVQRRVKSSLKDSYVIVTRSPALHPGDIQYVKMRTPPQGHPLRYLKNCIVFSQKGNRDLPSQLSGGDLDGDLYSVIWDPKARPKRLFDPADYPRISPVPLDRVVKRDDIANFFVNFMESDILGLIATRHQILADIQEMGTVDLKCVELAELHSTAVDYSKTGIKVNFSDLPKAPRTRPDFLAPAPPLKLYDIGQIDHILDHPESDDEGDGMGIAKHRFHKSEKILGRLYRGIDEQKIWSEEIKRPVNMDGPTIWEEFLGRVSKAVQDNGYLPSEIDYRRRLPTAWNLRNLYESAIENIMWRFSENPRVPITEVEAFCGSILKKTGSQTRRERDLSINLKKEMEEVMTWIVKLIRDRTAAGGGGGDDGPILMSADGGERERMNALELCWACVVAGCSKDPISSITYHGTGELESFRVVAACCLMKELHELFTHASRVLDSGGGYVGVSGGHMQHMVLPLR